MFVLEKLLRNFSEVEGTKTRLTPSIYDEMINEIEEWRNQPIISEEYHEVRGIIVLFHTKMCRGWGWFCCLILKESIKIYSP